MMEAPDTGLLSLWDVNRVCLLQAGYRVEYGYGHLWANGEFVHIAKCRGLVTNGS